MMISSRLIWPKKRVKHPSLAFSLFCKYHIMQPETLKVARSLFPDAKSGTVPMTVAEDRRRMWDELNPEILSLIFLRILPLEEMIRRVPFVCKGWNKVVLGPYCWSEVDVQAWCRRRNDGHAADLLVRKLIWRSKLSVRRLSAYRMGEGSFFYVTHCGNFLKQLQMPMSDINDEMVERHLKPRPLPHLTTLDISYCLKITSKGITTFGKQCKSLLHLKRNMPPPDTTTFPADDSEPKAIANSMPNLQQIELCYGRFGDSGLSQILTKCNALTHLEIIGAWKVELGGDLADICERLQHFQSPYWIDDYYDVFSTDDDDGSDVDVTDSD